MGGKGGHNGRPGADDAKAGCKGNGGKVKSGKGKGGKGKGASEKKHFAKKAQGMQDLRTVKAQGGALKCSARFSAGTPCSDFVSEGGNCRFGKKCSKLHNVPYSEAMMNDWLTPGNLKAQNKLREAAIKVSSNHDAR